MNKSLILSPTPSASPETAHASFLQYIWQERTNRLYLFLALAGTVVQIIIFKLLYPFPDFFSDSYSYLYGAMANLEVNIWPIGYSKFLRAFHLVTYSDTALIVFQYIFFQLSALYFYYTVLYFLRPGKTFRLVLYIFLFFNPLFLYLSNYINSDPVFAALSFLWFTHLIWIILRPGRFDIVVHAVLLFCCFTVRNNAYYYPFISVVAYLLSKQTMVQKAAGILAPALLIIPFILHTRNEAFKMTGTRQFSLFTGWQLANNALYMYEYATIDTGYLPTKQIRDLNNYSIYFYSHVQKDFRASYLKGYVGNFFIREPFSPLKTYYSMNYHVKDDSSQVVAWGKASAVFSDFASYLIKKNPGAYLWEFMGVNMRHYLLPPLEKLEIYNLGEDAFEQKAVTWFHFKRNKIKVSSKTIQGSILKPFPPLFFFLNAFVLGCLCVLGFRGRLPTMEKPVLQAGVLGFAFVLANFLFCTGTTIIVFRYEIFPMVILLLLTLLLTEHMKTDPITQKNTLHYA